ncbi:hypothetical protein H6G65_18995 [Microcystis elabens FACHB-917]|nr:hypothetical protein [Microcystis elabens FACHB-917]
MNIYQQWGFVDSPFQVSPLPPSDLGARLLIGRAAELQTLKRRLFNPPKIATIEGLNGVGKTSLVNVAAYQVYTEALSGWEGPLMIPCNTIFQLNANKDAEEFIDEVLMAVAQTLIDRGKAIDGFSAIKTEQLDSWLNAPQVASLQGSLSIMGNGAGIGRGGVRLIRHQASKEVAFAKQFRSGCQICFQLQTMEQLYVPLTTWSSCKLRIQLGFGLRNLETNS